MNAAAAQDFQAGLTTALENLDTTAKISRQLEALIDLGYGDLPLPGAGATWHRWRALAAVGRHDLSLAKHYEGHSDALAIIAEMGDRKEMNWPGAWGVWASESHGGRTSMHTLADDTVSISGSKLWCSGALTASQALVTAWPANSDVPQLVAVRLGQTGITIDAGPWKAVGMANSMSVKVTFENVACTRVGKPGAYLTRPGFWQGGAGVAACWLGGAMGIANTLHDSLQQFNSAQAHGNMPVFKLAALGKVYLAISQTTAILQSTAAWIDKHPAADASQVALAGRLSAEQCAKTVIHEVGQALGASPFCLDEKFARAVADLPVFIRQSHAEKDFVALGERVAALPQAHEPL